MQNTLDDAVERLWNTAKILLWQDHRRLRETQKKAGVDYTDKVGAENGRLRGMIYTILTPAQVKKYATVRQPIPTTRNHYIDIVDGRFVSYFSHALDENSERARVFMPHESTVRLVYSANLSGMWPEALEHVNKLVDEAFVADEALKQLYNEESPIPNLERFYSTFLPGMSFDNSATRVGSAQAVAMATRQKVIVARARIAPQPEYDMPKEFIDPATNEKNVLQYSRLGTGEIYLLGACGVERHAVLRIGATKGDDAVAKQHKVSSAFRKLADGSMEKLPVYMQVQDFSWSDKEQRVVPDGEPQRVLKESLNLYQLRVPF